MTTYVLGLVVSVDYDRRLVASLGDLNRRDLLLEPACLLGSNGLLVRADTVFVLLLTREAVVVGTLLSLQSHVLLLVCVGQTVLEKTINQRLVSELCAVTHVGEVVGRVGHALGSGSNDNLGIASHDCLGTDND